VLATVGFLSNLASNCIICPAGTSCQVGSGKPSDCLPGSVSNASQKQVCDLCEDGKFQRLYGQTACNHCTPGFYCKQGAAEPVPCPGGTTGNATGLYTVAQCVHVPPGSWAPLGSALPEPCPPAGFYCPGGLRDMLYGGSKPIIMPIGGSAETRAVPAVVKSIGVSVSIDEFQRQRQSLLLPLAAQYGVDPSLVTLEVVPGSVQLTLTIAATNGTSVPMPIDALIQAVNQVSDATLATSIGEVMNTNVSVISQNTTTGTVLVTIETPCEKGQWCTAGLVVNCSKVRTPHCIP
jgi:hypothetical protein